VTDAAALPRHVASVLREARQLYVGLESKQGPHVTPELYAYSDGRLWIAVATSTLKSRVLATGSVVAGAIVGRGATVSLDGRVEVFDPRRPRDLVRAGAGPHVVRALASFGVRNGTDLIGFARDTLTGKAQAGIPNLRVVMAIEPTRLAMVENDRVTWQRGWPTAPSDATADEVPAGGEPAVVAFDGPLVAPARWFADNQRLFVSPDLLALMQVPAQTGVAVVVDDYNEPGPAAKQGVLVRGTGAVAADGWVTVKPERTVAWHGMQMTHHTEAKTDEAVS
jgi:Pyridoxamine 5'-phosphate oxidase